MEWQGFEHYSAPNAWRNMF